MHLKQLSWRRGVGAASSRPTKEENIRGGGVQRLSQAGLNLHFKLRQLPWEI